MLTSKPAAIDFRTVHTNEILDAQMRTLVEIRDAVRTIKGWVIFWSLMSFLGGGLAVFAVMAAAGASS